MTILVAGASGFVGRNLLIGLGNRREVVATYFRDESFLGFLKRHSLRNVRAVRCDLTNPENIHEAGLARRTFERCVFLAANSDPTLSYQNPLLDFDCTAKSLLVLLEKVKIESLVFVSSGAVYEGLTGGVGPASSVSPTLPYAISKRAAESYVDFFKRRGTINDYLILRFFGAYGPYEAERKIYTRLVKAFGFDHRKSFTVRGDGTNLIDAMFVDDAVIVLKKILNSKRLPCRTLDFCAGKPMSISRLVTTVAKLLGCQKPRIHHFGTTVEPIHYFASNSVLADLYGPVPDTPLEVGIEKLRAHLLGKGSGPVVRHQ